MSWFLSQSILYPTLWYNVIRNSIDPNRTWFSEIEDQLYLGALPFGRFPRKLKELGIDAVINMCKEWNKAEQQYQKLGIEQLYLPTTDFECPSLPAIEQGVTFLEDRIAERRKVYVHCKAGRGRSATIVLCYLMKSRNITASEAQAVLREKRPHINRGLDQREFVLEFARKLNS